MSFRSSWKCGKAKSSAHPIRPLGTSDGEQRYNWRHFQYSSHEVFYEQGVSGH